MIADLTLWLRGFSVNAPRQGERERILEAAESLERLATAISWVLPPFVDAGTPEAELRKRVAFLVEDANRVLGVETPKPRVVYDMKMPPLARTLPDAPAGMSG